jgi:hypothetical protein
MLCNYQDMFNKVGEGVHSYRLFNLAIIDIIFTIIGAYLIHLFIQKSNFICVLICLIILGIILHRIFCVRTTVDKLLFN